MPLLFPFRCWFTLPDANAGGMDNRRILELMLRLTEAGFVILKAQMLAHFDGVPGYALGQGE